MTEALKSAWDDLGKKIDAIGREDSIMEESGYEGVRKSCAIQPTRDYADMFGLWSDLVNGNGDRKVIIEKLNNKSLEIARRNHG